MSDDPSVTLDLDVPCLVVLKPYGDSVTLTEDDINRAIATIRLFNNPKIRRVTLEFEDVPT